MWKIKRKQLNSKHLLHCYTPTPHSRTHICLFSSSGWGFFVPAKTSCPPHYRKDPFGQTDKCCFTRIFLRELGIFITKRKPPSNFILANKNISILPKQKYIGRVLVKNCFWSSAAQSLNNRLTFDIRSHRPMKLLAADKSNPSWFYCWLSQIMFASTNIFLSMKTCICIKIIIMRLP